jgi:outer membrane protein/protease secretion system outer membrane protein
MRGHRLPPLILIVFCASASALDLLEAYDAAQLGDATIQAARAQVAANRERLPQAQAGLLPSVGLSASRAHNQLDNQLPGVAAPGGQRYASDSVSLTWRQPVYNPARHAQVRQAQAQVNGFEAGLQTEEQAMAVRVATLYFEALAAGDEVRRMAAQQTFLTRQADAARRAFAAGSGTRTDMDEVQAQLDMALAQALEARQNVCFTRRKLQAVVGLPIHTLAVLDASISEAAPSPARGLDDWIALAQGSSPAIAAAQAQLDAADQSVERARAGHVPTVDAFAQWSQGQRDNINQPNARTRYSTIGLQLTVPLYAGGSVDSAVRQASAEREAARLSLQAVRLELSVRVHQEYRGLSDGAARVGALEQALRSASQRVDSTQKSYAGGSRSVIDVLSAEQQRATTLRDLAQARYALVMARVRMLALSNALDRDAIAQVNRLLTAAADPVDAAALCGVAGQGG